jgi:hypothetical protein
MNDKYKQLNEDLKSLKLPIYIPEQTTEIFKQELGYMRSIFRIQKPNLLWKILYKLNKNWAAKYTLYKVQKEKANE